MNYPLISIILVSAGLLLIGFGIFGIEGGSSRNNRYKLTVIVLAGTALYSSGVHQLVTPEISIYLTVLLSSLGIGLALSPLLFLKNTSREIDDFDEENKRFIRQQLDEGVVNIPAGIHESKWNYELSNNPSESKAQVLEVSQLAIPHTECGWCDWSGVTPLVTVSRIRGGGFKQYICPDCMMDIQESSPLSRRLLMIAITLVGGGGMTIFFVIQL